MDNKEKTAKLADLKIRLKRLLKDVQDGKIDRAKAADQILSLNEEIDKVTEELKLPL